MNDFSSLDAIVQNGFCTSCGLCAALAQPGKIEMRMSRRGHLRPELTTALTQWVSAAALIAWIVYDSRQQQNPRAWLAVVATCCIGVSCGLPLYLHWRHSALHARRLKAALK